MYDAVFVHVTPLADNRSPSLTLSLGGYNTGNKDPARLKVDN
jgi:hypothetical protein